MPTLTCRKVVFLSVNDEAAFFHWLNRIKAIQRWHGEGDCIKLQVPAKLSRTGFHEISALFQRYRINKRQLSQFQTSPSDKPEA